MKKLLAIILVLAIFASTFLAQGSPSEASPEETLPTYKIDDEGSSSPNIKRDGNTYSLTGNLEGNILIDGDNIVLDGAGYTIKGRGDSIGIAVYDKTSVTIKNVKVENFGTGILLGHYSPDAFLWYDPNPNRCTKCTISNSHVSNNTIGISVVGGRECKIIDSQATNNRKGIMFFGSGNVFRNNQMTNNNVNFDDLTSEKSDIDTSNRVDGKPIYYLTNQQNKIIPADAGIVHLESCQNITIQDLDIQHASKAIVLFNSNNCKIFQNRVANGEVGISLHNSVNSSVTHNELFNNCADAIEQFDSENTNITNNMIRGNGCGIDSSGYTALGSKNAVISNNQITANSGCGIQAGTECTVIGNYIESNGQHGIYFWDNSNSIISKNTITQNHDCGICFRIGKTATISGNDISKNNVGIAMGDLSATISECIITENNIAQNTNLAIRIDGDAKDNRFYLNNFIQNNNGSIQATIKGIWVYKGDIGYNENSNVFPQYYTRYNAWDDGSVGNYWSDYNSTPGDVYKIAINNQDKHPQTSPFQFTQPEMPQAGLETSPPNVSGNNDNDVLALAAVALAVLVIAALVVLLLYKRHQSPKCKPTEGAEC